MMVEVNKNGFVVLDRNILQWRWFTVPKTAHLFVYLILKANHADRPYRNIVIRRGELMTSLAHISEDTGLTLKEVRTALDHLKETGEVTDQEMYHGRLIFIPNYDLYQQVRARTEQAKGKGRHRASHGQREVASMATTGHQTTIYNQRNQETSVCETPTLDEVRNFAQEEGWCLNADRFFNYYASIGWVRNGNAISDWKALARLWAEEDREKAAKAAPPDDGLDCWGKPTKKEFE